MKALYERIGEQDMESLCQRLRGGASFRSAAQSLGIPWSTFARNLKLGRVEHGKVLDGVRPVKKSHASWAERLDRSYHEGELGLLAIVRKGEKGWQSCAWILERTRAQYRLTERPESFALEETGDTANLLAQALRDRNWPAVVALSRAIPESAEEPVDVQAAYDMLDLPTRRWLQRRLADDIGQPSSK